MVQRSAGPNTVLLFKFVLVTFACLVQLSSKQHLEKAQRLSPDDFRKYQLAVEDLLEAYIVRCQTSCLCYFASKLCQPSMVVFRMSRQAMLPNMPAIVNSAESPVPSEHT
jgi:hypothetical protein